MAHLTQVAVPDQGRILSKVQARQVLRAARLYAPYIAFALLLIGFSIASPVFLSLSNFLNIGRQTTLVTIIASGMTLVIVAGEIDLSVGSVLALAGVTAAMAMEATDGSMAAGIVAGVATGAAVGLVNGLTTTALKIPSFLVTLGVLGITRGVALLLTGTTPVEVDNLDFWDAFGEGNLFGIPAPMVITVMVLGLAAFLLHLTSFGRRIYAVGGNAKAARYSGINVARVKTLAFVFTGALAGLSGLVLTARAHAARPDIAAGLELDVLAAVILGGTSLFGGRGSIVGSLLGSLLIGVLNNGLTLVGFNSSAQLVVKGVITIAAVAFSVRE